MSNIHFTPCKKFWGRCDVHWMLSAGALSLDENWELCRVERRKDKTRNEEENYGMDGVLHTVSTSAAQSG